MIVQSASKAEAMAARARDCWDYPTKVSLFDTAFHGVLAIRSGTPFQFVLVIDVCSCQKRLVSTGLVKLNLNFSLQVNIPSFQLCCDKHTQGLRIHYPFAASGGALYPRGLTFIFNFLSKVRPITIDAVPVSASHSIGF